MIKRHRAIEPTIGHLWLKRPRGDAMHAVLCGAGHNFRPIIKKFKSCVPMKPSYRKLELFRVDHLIRRTLGLFL
jgi:hypothetical protein